MKTQYYTASSLDGFIADSQNSLDWLFQFGELEGDTYPDFIREVGAIAMGSTTYEWILNNLSIVNNGEDSPQEWPYQQPTWVFSSRTLPLIEGANIKFVQGDVRPIHQEMVEAAGDKNIWLVGGGDLVGQFHDHGLLDEVIVTIASVTLGSGAPLLTRKITTPPLNSCQLEPLALPSFNSTTKSLIPDLFSPVTIGPLDGSRHQVTPQ